MALGLAVAVRPDFRYAELIHEAETLLQNSFVVPDAALADVPDALKSPAHAGSNGSSRRRRLTRYYHMFRLKSEISAIRPIVSCTRNSRPCSFLDGTSRHGADTR